MHLYYLLNVSIYIYMYKCTYHHYFHLCTYIHKTDLCIYYLCIGFCHLCISIYTYINVLDISLIYMHISIYHLCLYMYVYINHSTYTYTMYPSIYPLFLFTRTRTYTQHIYLAYFLEVLINDALYLMDLVS